MNSRARALWQQAYDEAEKTAGCPEALEALAREKFTELIIKDCILAVNSADDSGENYWGDIIKEHFGVE